MPRRDPSTSPDETLGYRGGKDDPLYKIRKILLTGDERLTDRGRERLLEGLRLGDPHDEVLGGWLAREMVRGVYLTDDANLATVLPVGLSRPVLATTSVRSNRSGGPFRGGGPRS